MKLDNKVQKLFKKFLREGDIEQALALEKILCAKPSREIIDSAFEHFFEEQNLYHLSELQEHYQTPEFNDERVQKIYAKLFSELDWSKEKTISLSEYFLGRMIDLKRISGISPQIPEYKAQRAYMEAIKTKYADSGVKRAILIHNATGITAVLPKEFIKQAHDYIIPYNLHYMQEFRNAIGEEPDEKMVQTAYKNAVKRGDFALILKLKDTTGITPSSNIQEHLMKELGNKRLFL